MMRGKDLPGIFGGKLLANEVTDLPYKGDIVKSQCSQSALNFRAELITPSLKTSKCYVL